MSRTDTIWMIITVAWCYRDDNNSLPDPDVNVEN
jgi:hypothetical protein